MSETATADGANEPAGAVSTSSDLAARDLDPVTVSDTMFDDPGYTPLDLYNGDISDAGAPSAPVVASCPHAGRSYPASMLAASQEPVAALRGLEDFGVDCLLPGLADAGVTTVINRFSRAYIDVNRDPAAIDATMWRAGAHPAALPPCPCGLWADPLADSRAQADLQTSSTLPRSRDAFAMFTRPIMPR